MVLNSLKADGRIAKRLDGRMRAPRSAAGALRLSSRPLRFSQAKSRTFDVFGGPRVENGFWGKVRWPM